MKYMYLRTFRSWQSIQSP